MSSNSWASEWSRVQDPTIGPAHSYGQASSGCIAGAKTLAWDGAGYRVMHIERNRYYGHPNLVRAIETLGRQVEQRGLGELHVGDLGQPRGGPMAFGHRSHQSGLDVDVWFTLDPSLLATADPLRSNVNAPSMLTNGHRGMNYGEWTANQATVLELAAKLPGVDRIFVNPHIKQELCDRTEGNREWLRKIRPWYHHDDHFHLRMACPADSPECDQQDPVPPGEGCDEASLGWWLHKLPGVTPTPVTPTPKQPLPDICRSIVSGP